MGYEDTLRSLKVKDTLYVGGTMIGSGASNTPSNVYYVNRNVTASGSGLSWSGAFKTITEAVAAANALYTAAAQPSKGRGTIIYVAEGWYSETPITLSANDVWIIGTAPGNHDSTVLYGSATAGAYDAGAGGPALTITGSNCTIANMGIFTSDPLFPSLSIGASGVGVYGNRIVNCSFIRDVNDGALYGIADYGADGTLIEDCFFSTSCKTAGVYILSNGVINPVNPVVRNCRFVGCPAGIIQNAGHNGLYENNVFESDTSDRPGTMGTPIVINATSAMCKNNYALTNKANLVTGAGTINDIGNWGSDSST